jgi:hypothetical protein
MKKVVALVVLVAVVGLGYTMLGSNGSEGSRTVEPDKKSETSTTQTGTGGGSQAALNTAGGTDSAGSESFMVEGSDDPESEIDDEFDDRPAAEIYSSAELAFKAVQNGAQDYDDLILEQFTEPGEDCSWCPEFYSTVTSRMVASDTSEDERSYFAEVLAISGRVDNIKTLVQSIIDSGESEQADIYAEALELTIGGDTVVNYLASHMESENELLQESAVAAITNQGAPLAAKTLYEHTIQAGDADGYYSLGIGLAEMIPEDETLPYLDEIMQKRDPYSHLAVKALLNHGLDGTRRVIEALSNSKDPSFDRKMLEDAVDHVNYEEEIEEYLKKTAETSTQPVVVEFAKLVLEDFDISDEEE